jgi:hypothetical protein
MRLSIAATLILVASSRAVDSSSSPFNTAGSDIRTSDTSNNSRQLADGIHARGYFDPVKYADDATWKKYVDKGYHLKCIMEAPDQAAGFLTEDTRSPPSAASRWTGDLKG